MRAGQAVAQLLETFHVHCVVHIRTAFIEIVRHTLKFGFIETESTNRLTLSAFGRIWSIRLVFVDSMDLSCSSKGHSVCKNRPGKLKHK